RFTPAVLGRFAPRGPVELAGHDTAPEHPGAQVYGKGCHRDPVRSTRSFTAYRWGHKWVVLAMLVRFPFCRRRWALPLMVALYRPPAQEPKPKGKAEPAQPGAPPQEPKPPTDRLVRAHNTPVGLLGPVPPTPLPSFP